MNEVLQLVQQHGEWFYLITFFWTALEGESFVIFAALLAQKGVLNIWLLFAAAAMGSFCGDQVYFYLGRHFGTWILRRSPKIQPKLDKVFHFVEKNSTLFILTYRFMYGIRNVSSVALGMSKLPWSRFAILNFIAAMIWAAAFCGFGYLFGDVLSNVNGSNEAVVEHGIVYELTIASSVALVLALGGRFLYRRWKAAREKKRQEQEALLLETNSEKN